MKSLIATVGKRYKPVQNEELFAFADAIHDANADCRWESAGSLSKRHCLHQIVSSSGRYDITT